MFKKNKKIVLNKVRPKLRKVINLILLSPKNLPKTPRILIFNKGKKIIKVKVIKLFLLYFK